MSDAENDVDLLGGQVHISSLVVHVAPHAVAQVVVRLQTMSDVQVHASTASGKLVVTVETSSARTMSDAVSSIQQTDGVLSAVLVYQCADSVDAMNEELGDA